MKVSKLSKEITKYCFSELEIRQIAKQLAIRLEDMSKEIKEEERKHGVILEGGRAQHSILFKLVYEKMIPEDLSGQVMLMTGEFLRKKNISGK